MKKSRLARIDNGLYDTIMKQSKAKNVSGVQITREIYKQIKRKRIKL